MLCGLVRAAVFMAAIGPQFVHAAAVDEDRPTLARVEKMIGSREELGRLDGEMAQAYPGAHTLARAAAEVTVSHRRRLATHQEFRDPATGLHFRYLGNRWVKRCEADAGTKCFQLSGPGMAYGSEFFVRFELVDGSLSSVADSMWEKEGNGWVAFGRWKSRSAVGTFAGDGWQGLVANTVCGVGDERGFHGAAGECMTYLMSDGRRTLIMTTDGASGGDPETQATIRSVRFGDSLDH